MDTTKENKDSYNITFLVTMDNAFKLLKEGSLSVDEFRKFFDEMSQKYESEDVRILYQSKLDLYLDQIAENDK